MKVHLITLTNKLEHPNVIKLKQSIKYNNSICELHTIHEYDSHLKNLSKIYKTFAYIRDCINIKDKDILCIVDGHDVLFNKKMYCLEDIIPKFMEQSVDIIFSCENKCSHHTNITKDFFESRYKNRYLNSGVIIGYKDKYISLISDIIKNIDNLNSPWLFSDQRIIGNYIAIDNTIIDDTIIIKSIKVQLDIDEQFALTLNSSRKVPYCDIKAFFIHITYLANNSQFQKYNDFCSFLATNEI